MGFKSLGEVKAYLAARAFKLEIYRLVKSEPAAFSDLRYRSQIYEAAASTEMNVAEGYRRYLAGEFTQFLRVARGSLGEAVGWVQDGIDRGYFTDSACEHARELGDEAGKLITGLIKSLKPFSGKRARRAKGPTPNRRRTQGPRPMGPMDSGPREDGPEDGEPKDAGTED